MQKGIVEKYNTKFNVKLFYILLMLVIIWKMYVSWNISFYNNKLLVSKRWAETPSVVICNSVKNERWNSSRDVSNILHVIFTRIKIYIFWHSITHDLHVWNMQELALVSFLRAEHVKKLQELNYRIISNILHVIITRIKI